MSALIVIEGIDGAGTTTQAERLATHLRGQGKSVHLTREPSTGPVGSLLREFLAGRHSPADSHALGLLFAADRMDHLAREVSPALQRGEIVITDRYYHSSLAYQGSAEKRQWIRELNRHARPPEATVFLQIDPEVAAARRQGRGGSEEIFDALSTQRDVAAAYETVIEELCAEGQRIDCIDGSQSLDAVTADVIGAIDRALEEI